MAGSFLTTSTTWEVPHLSKKILSVPSGMSRYTQPYIGALESVCTAWVHTRAHPPNCMHRFLQTETHGSPLNVHRVHSLQPQVSALGCAKISFKRLLTQKSSWNPGMEFKRKSYVLEMSGNKMCPQKEVDSFITFPIRILNYFLCTYLLVHLFIQPLISALLFCWIPRHVCA